MSQPDENNNPQSESDPELTSNSDEPSEVLETSTEGGPFIPPHVNLHDFDFGNVEMAPPPPPSENEEELIVEVELAAGIRDLDHALTVNADPKSLSDTTPKRSFASVLRDARVIEARPVFKPEQVEKDEARINRIRERSAAETQSSESRIRLEELPRLSSYVRLKFPAGTSASEVISALKELPEVRRAVVVPRAAPPQVPTDPLIGPNGPGVSVNAAGIQSQWYLHRTRVPQAWNHTLGNGVVIADVDWGFRTSHQDLGSAIEITFNAVDGTAEVTQGPSRGHGTAVLGIAGARADGTGIAGYAPESTLWAIQADSGTGPQIFDEPWAEAIDFVARTDSGGRPKVIVVEIESARGGNYEQVPSVHRAIRAAIAHGCIVCVAAGNGDRPVRLDDDDHPFDPTGSILVGATAFHESENRRAPFSNFGRRIVVSAPGDLSHDVTCGSLSDRGYRNGFGGTSGAAPKVAGTIALMLSVNPNLKHDEVREILATTGSAITQDQGKPIGVFLNAEAAVAEARNRL